MKLIAALGNPGPQYERTRHNAGWMVLDRLIRRHATGAIVRARFQGQVHEVTIGSERTLLLRPLTFMNRSGSSLAEAIGFYKIPVVGNVLVLVDDMALPLGEIRVRGEGGDGGHNGLEDVQRALGTPAYARVRIGIDPKPPTYDDQADWVLGRFTDEELVRIAPALDKAADAAECFITQGLTKAMNAFNAPPPKPKPPRNPPANRPPGATGPTPPPA